MPTTIAIAGSANAGKTTLIRTITKGVFGQVEDRGGVTEHAEPVHYSSLHSDLIDTPGFQSAEILLHLLGGRIEALDTLKESDYAHDIRAVRAICEADACVYVVGADGVPLKGHDKEMSLVCLANRNTVGLINKTVGAKPGRIAQWRDRMKANGIVEIYEFDAHWDQYSRLGVVFSAVARRLNQAKRGAFEANLESFGRSLAETRIQIATHGARCMLACRQISARRDSEHFHHDRQAVRAALTEEVVRELGECLGDFLKKAALAYEIAVAGVDHTAPTFRESAFRSGTARVAAVATRAGIGSAIGGGIGLAVGLLMGPIGWAVIASSALTVGASTAIVGGVVGAGVGARAVLNETVSMELSPSDLKEISISCLTIIWCVTHHGFGDSSEVAAETFKTSREYVQMKVGKTGHTEWKVATEDRMSQWFQEQLKVLDA